jgi:hypothetical protein
MLCELNRKQAIQAQPSRKGKESTLQLVDYVTCSYDEFGVMIIKM